MSNLLNFSKSFSFNEIQLVNYIQTNQIWDSTDEHGGFKNSAIEINTSIDATAKAIISLKELQVVNQTIYGGAMLYISGHEQFGGGYSIDSVSNTPTLRSTFWAISALSSIQSLDWVSEGTIEWITKRQLLNENQPWNYGGFEDKENISVTTAEYSYFGIMSLSLLAQINSINKTAAALYLRDRQLKDGGFESMDGIEFSDLSSTFYAISALAILNDLELINQTGVISFLKQRQNLDISDSVNYGGFGNAPNVSCNVIETFMAINSLYTLNELDNINISAAILYLEGLQLSNGAFTLARGIDQPSISFSYYALLALNILALYEDNINPQGFNPILLYVFIISIVSILSFLAINRYKRRNMTKRVLRIPGKGKKPSISNEKSVSFEQTDTFKPLSAAFGKW